MKRTVCAIVKLEKSLLRGDCCIIFLYLAKFKRTYKLSFVYLFEFSSSRLLPESKINEKYSGQQRLL